jgi:predicted nucleic acid-binding protein
MEDERMDLVKLYSDKLLGDETFRTSFLDVKIARKSAELRAKYGFRAPDAIQLATAFTEKAEVFITNDENLKRVDGIKVIVLQDLVE